MKIIDAKVFVCCPGRNFVTFKVYTDQGVYGVTGKPQAGRNHVQLVKLGNEELWATVVWN